MADIYHQKESMIKSPRKLSTPAQADCHTIDRPEKVIILTSERGTINPAQNSMFCVKKNLRVAHQFAHVNERP